MNPMIRINRLPVKYYSCVICKKDYDNEDFDGYLQAPYLK